MYSILIAFAIMGGIQTQDREFQHVVFESFTRGARRSVSIYPDRIIISNNGTEIKHSILESEWKKFVQTLSALDLEKISTYEAPTSKRASDAAWHSGITVTMNGTDYASQAFDDENAPVPLKNLMSCISKFRKKYEK